MAFYSNSTINNLRSIAGTVGRLTKGKIDVLTNLDLQWKNNFEVIFYPYKVSLTSVLGSALDTAIANLYVQDIQGLSFPTLETEDVNGIKHVVGITSPEEITMEFLETDIGLVRKFVQTWMNQVYTPKIPYDGGAGGLLAEVQGISGSANPNPLSVSSTVNTEGHSYYYKFKDKQERAKKNAIIILKGTTGLPGIGGWIKLEGLRIKSATGFDVSQSDDEPMKISVPMTVDMVKFIVPLSALPF